MGQIIHQLKVLQSVVSTLSSGGRGVSGTAFPQQPSKAIRLYDFEASPFCRRVREVITLLNLDVEIYPCPKNGQRYRPVVEQLGGKQQFPFLVDDNTGEKLYESQQIINYLFQHYGKTGKVPAKYQKYPKLPYVGLLSTISSGLRGLKSKANQSKQPAQMLHLWSFDASPYSRLVREVLCELELAYVLHNVAKERWQDMGPAVLRLKPGKYVPIKGGKREKTMPVMGRDIQVPFLQDPNTGVEMFESAQIIEYLRRQYG